ncbi:MAG: tetratricopeptide repeat protein [Candidatus Hodarchaeales archaeon]|jgi:tetratricopeptide (TPR) repeat protein
MSKASIAELQLLEQTGQYYRIKSLLRDDPATIEQVWYLAETFLRLSELDKLGEFLKIWERRILTNNDLFRWLYYYSNYLLERGEALEALQSIEQRMGVLRERVEPLLRARITLHRAACYNHLGKHEFAKKLLDSMIARGEEFTGKQAFGRLLTARSEIHFQQGFLKQCEDDCREAYRIAKELGNPHDMGQALGCIGAIYERKGALTLAFKNHEEALELRKKVGNIREIGRSLASLADIYRQQGLLSKALINYNRALTNFEMAGCSKSTILTVLDKMASIHNHLGHLVKAAAYYERVVQSSRNHYEEMLALALANLAIIFTKQGRLSQAEVINKWSLAIFRKLGNNERLMVSLRIMKTIYQVSNQLDEALDCGTQYLGLSELTGNRQALAAAVFDIGYINFIQDRLTPDSGILDKFPSPPYQSKVEEGYKFMVQALLARREGKWNEAEKHLYSTLNIANFNLDDLVLCHELLVEQTLIRWLEKQSGELFETLSKQLDDWQAFCDNNKLTDGLYKVYLLKAKLAKLESQFEDASKFLNQAIDNSRNSGLPLHDQLAREELDQLTVKNDNLRTEYSESRTQHEEEQAGQIKTWFQRARTSLRPGSGESRTQHEEEQAMQLMAWLKDLQSILSKKEHLLGGELPFLVPVEMK